MRTIAIRSAVVIVAVTLQASFLNLALPKNLVVDLLPLIVLAWVILVSFEKIWPWIVTLGVFTDLFSFERIGINAIFFIIIAYAISFFSRRFLIERRSAGFLVITVFVVVVFLFLDIGRLVVLENFSIVRAYESMKELLSLKRILFQGILNILFFYLIYFPLNKIEKNIDSHENKIKVMS